MSNLKFDSYEIRVESNIFHVKDKFFREDDLDHDLMFELTQDKDKYKIRLFYGNEEDLMNFLSIFLVIFGEADIKIEHNERRNSNSSQ